jgi:hypothetical protein
MKRNIIFLLMLLISLKVYSQFSMDLEIRPRAEFRDGYKTLRGDNQNNNTYAAFISQRSRLNLNFQNEKNKNKIILTRYKNLGR